MSVKNGLIELGQSAKVASLVSTVTTGTGLGTILDLIPHNIGKLATLVGIVLSLVLIYTHLRKGHLEYKKTLLEIEILKKKEEDRAKRSEDLQAS